MFLINFIFTHIFYTEKCGYYYGYDQIWFNDGKGEGGELTTRTIGRDNAIARHGIHGLYRLFSFEVASDGFVKGMNTLYLKQIKATGPFQGLMYDYLRLETPPPPTSF